MTKVYSLGAVGDRELVVSKTEEDVSVTIWQKDSRWFYLECDLDYYWYLGSL